MIWTKPRCGCPGCNQPARYVFSRPARTRLRRVFEVVARTCARHRQRGHALCAAVAGPWAQDYGDAARVTLPPRRSIPMQPGAF